MRMFLISLLLAALVPPASAGPLTGSERNRALSELHATRKLLLDAISGLSEAQLRHRPAPDRWSVAEIADHIILTEDLYWRGMQRRVAGPPNPEKRAEIKLQDEEVVPAMADRTSKRTAVEANTPAGEEIDLAALSPRWKQARDRLIGYVTTTNDDLRSRVWPHRAYGQLDGFQWVLLACGHVHRHVAQINEVKASPGYPAK